MTHIQGVAVAATVFMALAGTVVGQSWPVPHGTWPGYGFGGGPVYNAAGAPYTGIYGGQRIVNGYPAYRGQVVERGNIIPVQGAVPSEVRHSDLLSRHMTPEQRAQRRAALGISGYKAGPGVAVPLYTVRGYGY